MIEREQEISIFDIFIILYKSKILISLAILVFTLAGYLYYNSLPLKVFSEYNISPILNKDKIKYNQFNSYYNKINITPEYLKRLFIEQIDSYEDVRLALTNSSIINRDDYSSKIEYELAIENYVLKFRLEENLINQPAGESEVKLIYTDTFDNLNRNQIILIFDAIINSANENVRKDVIIEFDYRIQSLERNNKYKKVELEKNIENIRKAFLLESNNRIIFLQEQATMARHLGIKYFKNYENKDPSITNTIIQDMYITEDDQYYLRGYDAIEKEIEIMKQRSLPDPYINEIGEYLQRINVIDQDLTAERARSLFEITPVLSKDDFKSIRLSTNYFLKIKVLSEINKVLLISAFIGFFIGSFFAISSYYINNRYYI